MKAIIIAGAVLTLVLSACEGAQGDRGADPGQVVGGQGAQGSGAAGGTSTNGASGNPIPDVNGPGNGNSSDTIGVNGSGVSKDKIERENP